MKMKNVWALFLASVMTVTMAAGCGNSEGEKKDTSADKSTSAISGEDTSDGSNGGSNLEELLISFSLRLRLMML